MNGNGSLIVLLALGLAAGASTLLGGWLALRLGGKVHLILGLSAGAVLGVALLDLLPEAIALGGAKPGVAWICAAVACGFFAYLVAARAVPRSTPGGTSVRGHFGAGSLTAHSFLDGLGIGLGFQASPAIGGVLAVAVLAHDIADGLNTVNVSLAGSNGARATRRWLGINAVAPLLGIGASLWIHVGGPTLAVIIAVFAGFFLYIGAVELTPESHRRYPHLWTTASTLIGALAIGLVVRLGLR